MATTTTKTPKNPNDISAILTSWKRSLGDGQKALEHAQTLVLSFVKDRSRPDVIVDAIMIAKRKKDDNAAQAIRLMVSAIFPGAKYSTAKDGKPIIKTKGCEVSDSAIETIANLVSEGASLRGPKLRNALKSQKDTPVISTDEAYMKMGQIFLRALDKFESSGVTFAGFLAYIEVERKKQIEAERETEVDNRTKDDGIDH